MSIEFLITTLIIVATPGTGAIFTIAAGLTRGPRAAVLAAFACTLGILPHILAAITGLAAILHASALAFQGVKLLGVAYLLWMAWETWRDKGALTVEEPATPQSASRVIRSGIIVNLLNPKLTIFFVAFLPQFVVPASANGTIRMLELSGVFMAVTFAVFVLYGLIAGTMRDKVISRPRVMLWVRRIFAGSFVALGARLATVTR
ncbi:MAG: LysE family translocator [Thermomicrobiales bacterium]